MFAAAGSLCDSRVLRGSLWALGLFSLVANSLSFGGDPEIHLVFAKHLLRGHALQFNPGIYSSGETSPLYMVVLAALLAVAGLSATAVFMKLLGVGSAIALLRCMRDEVQRACPDTRVSTLLASAVAAAPFFFFQAQLGMENMPFALIAAVLVRRLLRPLSFGQVAAISGAAHAAFFLRPEAVFVIAAIYGSLLLERRPRLRVLATTCCFSVVLAATVWSVEHVTGVPLQGAYELRMLASRLESFAIPGTPLRLNRSPWIFVAYAWPLLAAIAVRRKQLDRVHWLVFGCLVAVPLVAHFFNVLPNTHFTRYTVYVWFPLLLVVAKAMRGDTQVARTFALLFALNAACVACVEVAARVHANSFVNTNLLRTFAADSPREVERLSNRLCAQLDCSNPPVRIAVHEVQLRLRLDDRFEVHSVDGVVDVGLRRFVSPRGAFDLVRYLEAENIEVVLDFPTARAPDVVSLAEIYLRSEHGPVRVGCSIFERRVLTDGAYSEALLRKTIADCPAP